MVGLELPEELDKQITELAASSGQTKNTFIIQALTEWLEDNEAFCETNYLLRNPNNSKRLMESINEIEAGLAQYVDKSVEWYD